MAGTAAGGKAAAITNKIKHGDSFYAKIGKMGGSVSRRQTRYFFTNREAARIAGKRGGQVSRKTKKEGRIELLQAN